MTPFTISPITDPNEIELLRGKSSFNYTFDQATIDLLQKNFSLPDNLYLIAKKDTVDSVQNDELTAFCSIDRDWWEDNFFFIREIWVDPNFQKLGLGQELINRCVQHAKSKNAAGVVTETAFDNSPMRNLCAKCGFKEWDNPQWKDGVTYKLVF